MKILIVGGGLGGLSLAASLLQKGIKPTVVETHTPQNPYMDDFGLSLWANGRQILRKLGLDEKVFEIAHKFPHYSIFDLGHKKSRLIKTQYFSQNYLATLFVNRKKFYNILQEATKKADVRYGVSMVELEEGPYTTDIRFSDGTQEHYDLVVGADGLGSTVRDKVFHDRPSESCTWKSYFFSGKSTKNQSKGVTQIFGPDLFITLYPRDDNQYFGYVCVPIEKTLHYEKQNLIFNKIATIAPLFKDLGWDQAELKKSLQFKGQTYRAEMSYLNMHYWATSRIALMGDAVHGLYPLLGMGASLAFEDAWVLTEELKKKDFETRYIPLALAEYEKRRKRRLRTIQKTYNKMWRWFGAKEDEFSWFQKLCPRPCKRSLFYRQFDKIFREKI